MDAGSTGLHGPLAGMESAKSGPVEGQVAQETRMHAISTPNDRRGSFTNSTIHDEKTIQ